MSLSRRHFIGGVIATASAAKVLGSSLASTDSFPSAGQGRWIRKGMIDAGGTHEPYIFVVRRGGQSVDARQQVDYEQSEELIRQLHDDGVEVFHTHLYKGFGMEAEQEGMEDTRKAVESAHRLGMKTDTYVQWNSLMYETFFAEEPKAAHWIQRDIAGLPILLPYGYQQSFRYRPCFSNQEYLTYLKKVIHYAIVDVKTDFIHLDNFDLNAEPDSCHCPFCVAGFRNRLKKKYSTAKLKERFGFKDVDFINPPQWNRDNPPDKLQIIYDPAFQEWADFRCQLMADALQQIFEYAASLSNEVVLEINPAGITGENRAWESGVDHSRLLKFTGSFWSEEDNPQGYHADGRLVSKIRSYKLARTYSNVLLTVVADNPLALSEDLAFNHTLGFVGFNPILPKTSEYIDFYKTNREIYEQSEDISNVAVFRSYASLTYNNAAVQLSTILVEQALIQARTPFDLIFDDGLENLTKYKVIILPDTECLSDEQISILRRFVDNGGGLVATEQAGLYDEWRRVRVTPGLSGLIEKQAQAIAYQESVGSPERRESGAEARKQVGRGRVAYLSSIEFDGPMPPPNPGFAITNEFWKRPKNWKELIELVHWAAEDQIPFVVDGPEFLVANYTGQPQHRRLAVHLINYNAEKVPVISSIRVSAALPGKQAATKVTMLSPSARDGRQIEFTRQDARTVFTVPEVRTYALIVIEW